MRIQRSMALAPCTLLLTLTWLVAVPRSAAAQSEAPATAENGGSTEKSASENEGKNPAFPKLEFRIWSGHINVPDPVAVSVDPQGRVYATQTRRRKIQDLDIRANRDWIADDVGLQSIEDKQAFLRRELAIGGDQAEQSKRVDDWNQDGQHDWRDLTVVSEVIYRLVDTDDDGTADEMTVFAEDFKTEVTGIAAGVLAYDGDVYTTIAPDLWKLRDSDGDGQAELRQSIAHGFGLHIAYAGHDMHGPTVGPDGRIYWSIGDKGINVTTADGRNIAYPNQGGVMRCNPDGSDFEVFAHGLRNVQEVAFDQFGNMFGVDNDSDQPRERERFVYIVQDMDAGWRCHYQYRGSQYNPWTAERLWELPAAEHPAYIVPPISHYIDGPAGFKFNPGTALNEAYRDFFFLTGAPNGNQHAFRIEVDGDTFKMVDEHQIGAGLAIVGLAFGPDGGLYGANWDGGYPLDEIGSVVRIDVPGASTDPRRLEVKRLLAAGFQERDKAELVELLSHADQRVRQAAQFALVDRNAGDLLASVAIKPSAGTLARLHAIWGMGQLARRGDAMCRDMLGLLLKAEDAQVRSQAAKTYADVPSADGYALVTLLDDSDVQVRILAGLGLARKAEPRAGELLLTQADALAADQHTLRHSIVVAMASCLNSEKLAEQVESTNEHRRLCSVLALRRQGSPLVAKFLKDASNWVATEAARAIHDDQSIADALPELAQSLMEREQPSEAFARRALNAAFRLGDTKSADLVLQFALRDQAELKLRLAALESLGQWRSPPLLDLVEGRRRDLDIDRRDFDQTQTLAGLETLADGANVQLRAAALTTARQLGINFRSDTLRQFVVDEKNDDATRLAAMDSLSGQLAELQLALQQAGQSQSIAVQASGLRLLTEWFPQAAVTRLNEVLLSDGDSRENSLIVRQTAIDCLAKLPESAGLPTLQILWDKFQTQKLENGLQLDLVEAIAELTSRGDNKLRDSFANIDQCLPQSNPNTSESLIQKFSWSRDGGDASLGKEIFNTHVEAQCSRCHKIGKEGSEIGPELTRIADERDAEYLLRSIVQPSADIDAKYRSQLLLLASGEVVKGVVQSQDKNETLVADSQGNLVKIATDEIEESSEQSVSLMPVMTEVLTAREVRDLVAYLQTLRSATGDSGH